MQAAAVYEMADRARARGGDSTAPVVSVLAPNGNRRGQPCFGRNPKGSAGWQRPDGGGWFSSLPVTQPLASSTRSWGVPRLSRNRQWARRSPANRLHHVTNRGVDRSALFSSPIDRLVFLSILAAVCLDSGIRVHAFCLLTNHFHLLLEDPRGMLSHAMLRIETTYARFVRDTSGRRGNGHIFGDRFWSRAITGALDYRRVVAYILCNPLECRTPLAESAGAYTWSSAAAHIGVVTAGAWATGIVELFGGVEAVLGSLPEPKTKQLERARRHRMACLTGGEWLDVDSARQGLTGQAFAASLVDRAASGEPSDEVSDRMAELDPSPAPRSLPEFRGHAKKPVIETIERLTGESGRGSGVQAYVLWRFSRDGRRQLAAAIGATSDEFIRTVQRIGRLRLMDPAANEAVGRLEWRMTFALGGAPWRV